MKAVVVLLSFSLMCACALQGREGMSWSLDPVTGEPLLNRAGYDAIHELERKIIQGHDDLIKQMPGDIRQTILACNTADDMLKLPFPTQRWLMENPIRITASEASGAIEKLLKHAKLHGDDIGQIMAETFWCRLHGKPFELDRRVCNYITYWKENAHPETHLSSQGLGKITWIGQLDVKERPHGVMWVGLDVRQRK